VPRSVLARVGSSDLTLDEVCRTIDTTNAGWRQQLPQVVGEWINAEMLYQEAKDKGIEDDVAFREKANDAYRQLLIQQLLQQVIYSDTTSFSEEALRSYFEKHAGEFYLREDIITLNMIALSTREQASRFAAMVAQSGSWNEVYSERMRDSAFAGSVVLARTAQNYTQHSIYPPEAWKVAVTLPVKEISFPVKTSIGYYVLQATAKYRQGAPAEFELVRDEVRARLLVEYHHERMDRLLGTLRQRYNVQVFVTPDQSNDTLRTTPHE